MAFSYNKKNLANTTITGAITSSDTSITVDDATVFPSGYFYATLMPSSEMSTFSNSEIVLVTNISSNTLTIARGQKNTTAKAFSAGAIITNGVYTEDLDFAQSVGKKIFSATWGGQESPYYKITDDMLKVVPDEGTSIRAIFDTDYASGTARLSINESTSGVATVSGSSISITDAENLAPVDVKLKGDTYQFTTTGKNKFNMNTEKQPGQTWYYAGINITMNPDQSISFSGTTTIDNVDIIIMGAWAQQTPEFTIPAGTYTTSFELSGNLDQIERYIFCINDTTVVRDFSSLYAGDIIKTATIEAPQPISYVMFRIAQAGQQVNGSFKIQIEQGSTATSFEPYTGGNPSPSPDYPQNVQTVTGEQTITISDGGSQSQSYTVSLGSIELCKIGTYQDYIYKNNGNWYVHKELKKIVFNGTETWYPEQYGTYYRFGRPISDIVSTSGRNTDGALCDHFMISTENGYGLSYYGSGYIALWQPNSSITTGAGMQNWLASNITTYYYPLATATDTQITDATLISQLNALANNKLYAGTNNIVVTGGLDGILEVQYYRSGSGVNLVPIVNGAYVADDNTRNVAPVKAGIPYDLTYHNGNWYVMNMAKKLTADGIDFTTFGSQVAYTDYVSFGSNVTVNPNTKAYKILPGLVMLNFDIVVNIVAGLNTIGSATNKVISPSWGAGRMTRTPATQGTPPDVYSVISVQALTSSTSDINIYTTANTVGTACAGSILLVVSD